MARKNLGENPRKSLKKEVTRISEGLFEKLVDLVLAQLFLLVEGAIGLGDRVGADGVWEAFHRAERDLEKINYQSIKNTIYYLKRRGLITYFKEEKVLKPILTRQGKRRLTSILPVYIKNRLWDGKLYLVTYDIAEKYKAVRDLFREHLKRIGARMFQQSVWLITYDPTDVLADFINTRRLEGSAIISCFGKDGNIGSEDVKSLVTRVYKLDELNKRYVEFIERFSSSKTKISIAKVAFSFYSILQDDPQLPFELLPDDWKGDEAYKLFKKITGK